MKYRRGVLDDVMLRCCENTMRKACGDFGADLREFNGEADHVHLLVEYPPKVPGSALVNSLKGISLGEKCPIFMFLQFREFLLRHCFATRVAHEYGGIRRRR